MTTSTRSYDHGTSATPLISGTIGEALDKAAERWPDREAVVVRDQAIRLTFAELRREVDRLAAGLSAVLATRRPNRHLVAKSDRVDFDTIRDRQGRIDPGEYQSGLSCG